MAVQTLRGGVVTSAGANSHHQFAMLAGDAVTLGQYPGSTITSSVSSLHIKQEIQIPQVRRRLPILYQEKNNKNNNGERFLQGVLLYFKSQLINHQPLHNVIQIKIANEYAKLNYIFHMKLNTKYYNLSLNLNHVFKLYPWWAQSKIR